MKKVDDVGLRLQIGEQQANAFEVQRFVRRSDQIGLPANDQLLAPFRRAGPEGEARIDKARAQFVDLVARGVACALR